MEEVGLYPPRVAGRSKLEKLWYLPVTVKRTYEETDTALCSDLPMLAGVGIRALVEAVGKEEVPEEENTKKKRKSLQQRIDELVQQGLLTSDGAEILQKLRLLGNDSAHEMKRHNTQTLGMAFDVVEHLLLGVYILPGESEKIK